MPTAWRLKDYLRQHNVTPYALSLKTGGRLSRNTIYSLVREQPQRLQLKTLDVLIPALMELTGEPVSVTDLLAYNLAPPEERGSSLVPSERVRELAELLEAAGPLKVVEGRGKPRGSAVRIARGTSVAEAVVEERDERESMQ